MFCICICVLYLYFPPLAPFPGHDDRLATSDTAWCDDDDLWGGGGEESLTLFNNLEDQISQIAAFNTDLNISELETVCHHF